MACLKFSELSKELNEHFSNNKDEQKKKDKAIRNLVNDFRSVFESAGGKACEKSYNLNNNKNDFINASNLSDLANDLFNDNFINTIQEVSSSTPTLIAEIPEIQSSSNSPIKNVQDCQEAVASCSKEQTNSENSSENEGTVEKRLVKEKERGNNLLIRIHCNYYVTVSASVLIRLVTRKYKLYSNNTVQ